MPSDVLSMRYALGRLMSLLMRERPRSISMSGRDRAALRRALRSAPGLIKHTRTMLATRMPAAMVKIALGYVATVSL